MGELLVFLIGGEIEDGDTVVDLEAEGVDEVVDEDYVFEGSVGYYAEIFDETSWVKGELPFLVYMHWVRESIPWMTFLCLLRY